jgi:hypothetical protein
VKGMKPAAPKNGKTYGEEDWNETSTLEQEAYWLSKVRYGIQCGQAMSVSDTGPPSPGLGAIK